MTSINMLPKSSTFLRLTRGSTSLLLFLGLLLAGCDSSSSSNGGGELSETIRISDLEADPFVDIVDGRPVGAGVMTYFNLSDSEIIVAANANTPLWDIALQGTTIIVNGGLSGPGNGAIQIVEGLFEEIKEAPLTGWSVDAVDAAAIPPGSGNGWYNYNPATMVISPIPGRVILVRTADEKYAKIRILSYYKGSPEAPTAESEARFVTFEYVIQSDGSRSFEK